MGNKTVQYESNANYFTSNASSNSPSLSSSAATATAAKVIEASSSTECHACSEEKLRPANSQNQMVHPYMHSGCPLNRREVGRAAWAFLHTTAAYYPDHPTPQQQDDMRQFMLGMAKFYPCGYCADRTVEAMTLDPPQTQSQYALTRWLCRIHNEVNERLGKPIFDCEQINRRWKTGPADGSCD